MNYFSGCSNYEFTEGQVKEINRSINSSSRDYLITDHQPNTEFINEMPELIYPIQSENVGMTSTVELEWSAVENADWYLVEIDLIPTIDFDVRSFITNDTKIIIDHLDTDRNYFWKITPFNEYYTCSGSSEVERFKTSISTSVEEIASVESFAVYPTIARSNQTISLEMESQEPFDGLLSVFDYAGKPIISEKSWTISQGFNKTEVQFNNLPSGIYILQVATRKGSIHRKILVQ